MDLLKCLWALLVMGGKKTNNMLMETGGEEFLMIQWEKSYPTVVQEVELIS